MHSIADELTLMMNAVQDMLWLNMEKCVAKKGATETMMEINVGGGVEYIGKEQGNTE